MIIILPDGEPVRYTGKPQPGNNLGVEEIPKPEVEKRNETVQWLLKLAKNGTQ